MQEKLNEIVETLNSPWLFWRVVAVTSIVGVFLLLYLYAVPSHEEMAMVEEFQRARIENVTRAIGGDGELIRASDASELEETARGLREQWARIDFAGSRYGSDVGKIGANLADITERMRKARVESAFAFRMEGEHLKAEFREGKFEVPTDLINALVIEHGERYWKTRTESRLRSLLYLDTRLMQAIVAFIVLFFAVKLVRRRRASA
jgi:hypothetical protein